MVSHTMNDLIIMSIFWSFLLIPLILTVLNLVNLFLKKKIYPNLIDGLIMILGPIFTILLFAIWDAKDYNKALEIPLDQKWHTPIASWHMPTIIALSILGIIGYIVLRKFKLKASPLVIVVCISCMLIGSLIGAVWMIQLSPHIFEEGKNISFEVLYFYIFPINYIVCCFTLVKEVVKDYIVEEHTKQYKSPILNKCFLLLRNSRNWPIISIILMLPILGMTLLILILFGQQPNAVIKAFTETSDWLLSQKISPQPVEVNAHYLCTVSLRGHSHIVKPLRYGVRRNQKIIVNRQLCVANAFEQLMQERVPKVHKFIRNIYDKYGYPLSKHIISPISADIVYILMKPLEWFFVLILYLFDAKPEDIIARQYLPLN